MVYCAFLFQGTILSPLVSSFYKTAFCCLEALTAVTYCLPNGVNLEKHLSGVYSSLLLHMDDSNENIRNAALETLRITGSKCPKLCLSLTSKAAEKNVHKDPCNQLIEHLQSLTV